MRGHGGRERPESWPEPKEPPPGARAVILVVIGLAAAGIAVYGAATTDPDADVFLLFLGAAVAGLAVAIRHAASLVAERRRHRDG